MARPIAGIVCDTRSLGEEQAQTVINRYVAAAMTYADVGVLLIPAMPGLMSAAEAAQRLDGLMLSGSVSNLDPSRYGQTVENPPGPFDPNRDSMSLDMIKAMLDLGKPVFGVCRGFQEINVAFGGSLRRDMADSPDLIGHHAPPGADLEGLFAHRHPVQLSPGGVLSTALEADRIQVNSVHYQGVDRLGEGLAVEARADDGVVEAYSANSGGASVLAVQWHPEWRTKDNPQSQAFFRLFGDALRSSS